MTKQYIPQVGDRIKINRDAEWYIDVVYADDKMLAGYTNEDDWYCEVIDAKSWVEIEKPEPLPPFSVVQYSNGQWFKYFGPSHIKQDVTDDVNIVVNLIPFKDTYKVEVERFNHASS